MSRALFLLYALISYAIFFATFLYLVAFVGNLPVVPRTVDAGSAAPFAPALALDLGLVALFGAQHSVMARQGFKRWWAWIVPAPVERSTYVVFSSLALIVLFAFWHPLPAVVWAVIGVPALLLWALFAAGWAIVLLSTFLINHLELFGLQQVVHHWRGVRPAAPRFRRPLFYRVVRHPLYSGFLLAFWATPAMSVGKLAPRIRRA